MPIPAKSRPARLVGDDLKTEPEVTALEKRPAQRRALALSPFIVLFLLATAASGESLDAAASLPGLTSTVQEFRDRLGISESVSVVIVPHNPHLASAERSPDDPHRFVISLDAPFLATLDVDEARAVLAHEMGHVWIFTHHPYLQTEKLANRNAARLVSSVILDRVYQKVGAHGAAADAAATRSDRK